MYNITAIIHKLPQMLGYMPLATTEGRSVSPSGSGSLSESWLVACKAKIVPLLDYQEGCIILMWLITIM